jgi:phasin family protein
MTTQYERQAETILKASQLGQLPEHVQAAAHDGLANTREATLKSIGLVKTLAAKALDNALANTEAAFDAAQAIARAKDMNEAAQLQAKFVQAQFAKAGEQGKEFYELAAKLTQQTFATLNNTTMKSITQLAA